MKTGRVLQILLLATAAYWLPAAHAYRPFDGTDAAVADDGEFELELGPVQHLREGSQRSWIAPAFVANWGLRNDRELVFEGQVQTLQGTAIDSPRTRWVDSALSLKQVHRKGSLQDAQGLSIASECGVLLPDSTSGTHVGATCAAIFSQRLPAATLHFNAALSRTRERKTGRFLSLIAEGPAHAGVRPVAEVFYENDGGTSTRSALAGIIWQARDSLAFDAAVRFAHSGGVKSREIRGGLTWSWSSR